MKVITANNNKIIFNFEDFSAMSCNGYFGDGDYLITLIIAGQILKCFIKNQIEYEKVVNELTLQILNLT